MRSRDVDEVGGFSYRFRFDSPRRWFIEVFSPSLSALLLWIFHAAKDIGNLFEGDALAFSFGRKSEPRPGRQRGGSGNSSQFISFFASDVFPTPLRDGEEKASWMLPLNVEGRVIWIHQHIISRPCGCVGDYSALFSVSLPVDSTDTTEQASRNHREARGRSERERTARYFLLPDKHFFFRNHPSSSPPSTFLM